MTNAKRDDNRNATLLWVSSVDGVTPLLVQVNPATNRMLVDLSWWWAGANTSLTNLSAVAINTTLVSDTDNTDALWTTAIAWSDLFLGSWSVITWNSAPSTADVTLTHSANTLTFAGWTVVLWTATATWWLTWDVTWNCSWQAGTVATITWLAPDTATTQAAQPNITSLWTLTWITLAWDITSTATAIDWDLLDNNASALSFDATDKAWILTIVTTDWAEWVTMSWDLVVAWDFTVNWTTTTIDTTTLIVEDKNIEMWNVTTPSDATADGWGITLLWTTNKTITWDNANDNWTFNQNANLASSFDYKINNVSVLNATTLWGAVVASSLTSVWKLTALQVNWIVNAESAANDWGFFWEEWTWGTWISAIYNWTNNRLDFLWWTWGDPTAFATNVMTMERDSWNVWIWDTSPDAKLDVLWTIKLTEQAAADADTAAKWQIWVKTWTPNTLWFTDDAWTDAQLWAWWWGLTWGDTITSTSWTWITTTLWASSAAVTTWQSIVIDNTQTNKVIWLDLSQWTSTPTHQTLRIDADNTNIKSSILMRRYTASTQAVATTYWMYYWFNFNDNSAFWATGVLLYNEENAWAGRNTWLSITNNETAISWTTGAWIALTQAWTDWTMIALSTGSNVNCSTNWLVNYTLGNTQSWATTMQEVDLWSSAQAHTWVLVTWSNASATAKAFDAGMATWYTWSLYNWSVNSVEVFDVDASWAIRAAWWLQINAQTWTTYWIVLADAWKMITLSNAAAITITIPANATIAMPVWTIINLEQLWAGQVTVAITTDTLNSKDSNVKLTGQYSWAYIRKVAATEWILVWDLAA